MSLMTSYLQSATIHLGTTCCRESFDRVAADWNLPPAT